MSSPFDTLAPDYAALWTETPRGASQRARVWRSLDRLFQPGDEVLDLGCGAGDDAVHLGARGVKMFGIDASEKMIALAQARGVRARRLAIEELDRLEGPFSGAISNFGALNCVASLRPVAEQLARLVRPGGAAALCVMGRFAPLETLRFLCKFDWAAATRRWRGQARWRGIEVYYHSSAQMRKAFANGFIFEGRVFIGGGDHELYIFRRRKEC